MTINLIDEYNSGGHLVHFENFVGAYVRGKTLVECLNKVPDELKKYLLWANSIIIDGDIGNFEVKKKFSILKTCDADSDIIFNREKEPISLNEYERLKALALKSAQDFLSLYLSIPDKNATTLLPRETFYGQRPITPYQMYLHTTSVNSYYFGEIGINADNEPDIYTCRMKGFQELEKQADFLSNRVFVGSYNEQWSLKKLLRRFIWHDRIHAKAMFRVAYKLYGDTIKNPFYF